MVLLLAAAAVAETEAEEVGALTAPLPLSVALASALELSDLVVELFADGSAGLSFVSGMKPAATKEDEWCDEQQNTMTPTG